MEQILLGEGATPKPAAAAGDAGQQDAARTPSLARQAANDQLVALNPTNGGKPLFCFHPGGGQLDIYKDLVNYLPPELSVVGVKANPAASFQSIDAMAEAYLPLLRQVQPEGPYRLFGFSLGGFVALATAALLEADGEEVSFVGLADSKVSAGSSQRETFLQNAITELYGELNRFLSLDEPIPEELLEVEAKNLAGDLLRLPEQAVLDHLLGWVLAKLPDRGPLTSNELENYLALLIQHVTLAGSYRPKGVNAPLYTWTSTKRSFGLDETEWQRYTSAEHKGKRFDVGHYELMRPPIVADIAKQISTFLDH